MPGLDALGTFQIRDRPSHPQQPVVRPSGAPPPAPAPARRVAQRPVRLGIQFTPALDPGDVQVSIQSPLPPLLQPTQKISVTLQVTNAVQAHDLDKAWEEIVTEKKAALHGGARALDEVVNRFTE